MENPTGTENSPENPDFQPTRKPTPAEERFARIAPYRWKPGDQPYRGGQAMHAKALITDAYKLLLNKPFPGDKEGRTGAQLLALAMFKAALRGSVTAAQEITNRIEGKLLQRAELSGVNGQPMQFEQMGSRAEVEAKIASIVEAAQERFLQVYAGAFSGNGDIENLGEDPQTIEAAPLPERKVEGDRPARQPARPRPAPQIDDVARLRQEMQPPPPRPRKGPVPQRFKPADIPRKAEAPPMDF